LPSPGFLDLGLLGIPLARRSDLPGTPGNEGFHPAGSFVEFKKEEVEQSIPSRFERRVSEGPDRIAVKSEKWRLSYAKLNSLATRIARAILDRRRAGDPHRGFNPAEKTIRTACKRSGG
jgi:non-ribosomal peptide synthetase component F